MVPILAYFLYSADTTIELGNDQQGASHIAQL